MSVDRIRKLLRVAADQEGTPEGETAARIARDLIERQAVALSELDLDAQDEADPFVRLPILLGGPAHWRCRLLSLVAEHCACIAGYRPGTGKASLYGRRSAVELAEYLYVLLSRAMTRERVAFTLGPAAEREEPERTRAINNFTQSAILALSARLEGLRRSDEEARPDAAALVRSQLHGVEAWMRREGLTLGKAAPFPYAYSEEGYRAGYRLPLVSGLDG